MLNNLSEQIRDCYRHAQDCARKAAEQADPNLKQAFGVRRELAVLSTQFQIQRAADVDRRKNYEFVQNLESFVLDAHGGKIEGE